MTQTMVSCADTRVGAALPDKLGQPALMVSGKGFHIPSLDGIRAVAVSLVVVAHAGLDHLVPGGLGVTIFFFLSGFLITSLLRHEFERTADISLRKFYLRRVLRIWPPMYLMLAASLAACLYTGEPIARGPLTFQAIHLGNYQYYLTSQHPMPGTGVLWSLAVEEHFYLMLPAAAIFLLRRMPRRRVAVIFMSVCALILAWRCLLVFVLQASEGRTYYATDTRIDSILFGSILALYCNPYMDRIQVTRFATKLLMLGFAAALILASLLIRRPAFRESIRYTIQGLALFPLFYLAITQHRWPVFRWLNWAPVRAIGVISYAIYLFNFVVQQHLERQLPRFGKISIGLLAILVTLLLATASYYAIERPCAAIRKRLHV